MPEASIVSLNASSGVLPHAFKSWLMGKVERLAQANHMVTSKKLPIIVFVSKRISTSMTKAKMERTLQKIRFRNPWVNSFHLIALENPIESRDMEAYLNSVEDLNSEPSLNTASNLNMAGLERPFDLKSGEAPACKCLILEIDPSAYHQHLGDSKIQMKMNHLYVAHTDNKKRVFSGAYVTLAQAIHYCEETLGIRDFVKLSDLV